MADEARVRKVQERILQTVASMIGRQVKDPRLELVTITDVRVTGDLQHASIFYTVLGDDEQREKAARAFASAQGLFRSRVGKVLGLRLTPTLEFIPDALPESAAALEDALAKAKAKDEAIAALKHGATETTSKEVNEEGNPVKTNVTVALTDEPADTRSGTPTVYLGLNEDGAVVQAGYSAATASLGYGSLSFVDAVKNEGIIEKTLQEAGVNVPAGSAQLPADKTEYSEYASDGTTLVKESYSFSGTVDLNGAAHEWSALLLYNYSTANTSGNLADTIRIVYVYVNA